MSTHILFHWTLLTTAIFAIAVSIFQWKSNHEKSAILLLLIGGILLRIFVSKDGFLHEWDERYHALVAKNLGDDFFKPMLYKNALLPFDYKEWASNHIWLHKQPFPLWCMAFSIKLFGVTAFAIRIPTIIFSSLLIPVVYEIGKILFNKRVAFMATLLCSIHGLIIEQTGGRVATDHIDVYFLCFIAYAVYGTLKYHQSLKTPWIIFTGFCLSAAILSKWLPALIVIPIWGLSANVFKRSLKANVLPFAGLVFLIAFLVLPWQWYIHSKWPLEAAWESQYNRMHIFEALGSESGGLLYHVNRITIIFGELIFIPFIWLLWYTIKKKTNPKLWLLLIWILIPLLFFTFVKTKMQGYLLFTAPAFFLLTAYFIEYLYRIKSTCTYPKIVNIIIIFLFILPFRYSIERIKPLSNRSQEMTDFKKEYVKYDDKTVIFNEEHYIEAMFYSECAAVYPYLPKQDQIEELKTLGYRLIIKE